jgi:hypothetical protein
VLLFLVQPLFARMLLPRLGSSPVVWNTALVFYQAGLLVGYAYAHLSTTRLGPRRQALLHVVLLLGAGLALPVALRPGLAEPSLEFPVPWLLGTMLVSVGAPYVAVASTSPLLQRWFAFAAPGRAADPYFLYAASNGGSIAGLLTYPFLVEPALGLGEQSRLWSAGYGLLVGVSALCAVSVWRSAAPAPPPGRVAAARAGPDGNARLRWLLLAALPSALLVSVTAHVSADVAAVPLLWVIPLALYLLTYVIAFSGRAGDVTRWATAAPSFWGYAPPSPSCSS